MKFLEKAWFNNAGWLALLWPLSFIFQLLVSLRRKIQQRTVRPPSHTVPVVVIGNISVGGTGKTPLLIELARHYKRNGFAPGIISRGYGASTREFPLQVEPGTDVHLSGDEALLMRRSTGCPVVIDPDRERALRHLLEHNNVDVVFSDDGLQHYKLHRDIEIAVVDGARLFGNGFCLPAGPLRERVGRLQKVDFIIVNGTPVKPLGILEHASLMRLEPRFLVNLKTSERRPLAGAPFTMGNTVQAVAAIGNPERFFSALAPLPYQIARFPFPDHHCFSESDFESGGLDPQQPIVMTEKDAVKCEAFARANFWVLNVEVKLPQEFLEALSRRIIQCKVAIGASG